MLMLAYLIALTVHGPWDDWMKLFFVLAVADFLVYLGELIVRAITIFFAALSVAVSN